MPNYSEIPKVLGKNRLNQGARETVNSSFKRLLTKTISKYLTVLNYLVSCYQHPLLQKERPISSSGFLFREFHLCFLGNEIDYDLVR